MKRRILVSVCAVLLGCFGIFGLAGCSDSSSSGSSSGTVTLGGASN